MYLKLKNWYENDRKFWFGYVAILNMLMDYA